jgi:hypothetical protein
MLGKLLVCSYKEDLLNFLRLVELFYDLATIKIYVVVVIVEKRRFNLMNPLLNDY